MIYDDVTPSVTVTTYSSNDNTGYAKLDDRVYVRLNASERLRPGIVYMSATILDHDADETLTSSNNDSTFTAYIVVEAGDQEGQISFSFTYQDLAGAYRWYDSPALLEQYQHRLKCYHSNR